MMEAVLDGLAQFEANKVLPLEVRRLRLEPGDTLVLRTPRPVPPTTATHLAAALREQFPGAQVLVLESGLDLEIVSQAPQPLGEAV
jgi:hypothetical protein